MRRRKATDFNNDGSEAIVGTFSGLPNGSVFTAGGLQFRITYGDVFGNDVVLSVTNTALRLTLVTIGGGGNFNGAIDSNECFSINVVLTNVLGTSVTDISATLVPHTPGISVTQPFSAYPDMPVGGRSTNLFPFQLSVLPGLLCGTNLELSLVVQTAGNGAFTVPVRLPSGAVGPATRFNNNVAVAIPDLGSVDSTILVSGIDTPIKRVSVSMHITHTADGDLDISLIAPDGTTINLSSDNGGTSSDYGTDCGDAGRTTFIDTAATAINFGSAPFVGSFRPEQALVLLNNKFGPDVNGVWTLRVADDAGGAVGTLRCWSLFISDALCADGGGACESCPERTILGSISDRSSIQNGRLARNLIASTCAASKTCSGPNSLGSDRLFDAYTFVNGESNACITVSLSAACDLFSAAYLDTYNPAILCQNYLADMGNSLIDGGTNSYSFQVGARETFVVVVNQVDAPDLCDYRLAVTGGSCRPVLDIARTSPGQVLLDWSTAAIGYRLERTNALATPPGPLWVPVLNAPSIIDSRFTISQPASGSNQFYRLRQP